MSWKLKCLFLCNIVIILIIINNFPANQRPKVRAAPINILESVRQTLSNADEGRKRADLESTLYSRWRLGMDQERILRESKTNHQAMAKLSWLDRQLENQLENERQKKENNILELKLHEEKRKHENYLTSCNKQRENELSQVKSMQEDHVHELKLHDREIHDLKLTENTLRKKLDEIKKEMTNMTATAEKRRDRMQALHNYRKIKMMLRERSEAVRRHLQQDLNLLDRLSFDTDFDNNEEINFLKLKIQGQHDKEAENCRNLETMYESEAKDAMNKQIQQWDDESMLRDRQLQLLMEDRHQVISERITACVRRQQDVEEMRQVHMKAIDNATSRLKELMDATMSSGLRAASAAPFERDAMTNHSDGMLIKKTNDVVINASPDKLCLPKYGRKKVAWT